MLHVGPAPAKLNLALELTGRREDGYHLLAAVSQTIDWCDVVALETAPRPSSQVRLSLAGPEAEAVPPGAANVAVRAASLLCQNGARPSPTRVAVDKRIPPGSGLGGGSADAAAVLRLGGTGLDSQLLSRLALQCGADVPFALLGGAAELRGIGELLSPLPSLGAGAFVVAVLGQVPTEGAYSLTRDEDFGDGSRVARLALGLRQGAPLDPALLGSGLEPAALRAVPALADRVRTLRRATPGTLWAMTGSGGGFFSYQGDAAAAARIAQLARAACAGAPVRVALPLDRSA